ncbi:phenylacetate--CoA ligase family protein [Desulfosediminicola flagellatus]|uniref:phenylacetate--CoA ligase family protein n=1 Tax=Desulfosediminicola flagellatus TaxID=2569541 RepID=UPI0010AB969B|nr:AMP-binding protein [Desulfosediminicola flagellatus]
MNTELYSPYRLEQALRLRQESPENIAQEQLFLLKKHLEHALNTPFYRKLYAGKDIAIDSFEDIRDISQLPFTTRQDIDLFGEQFDNSDKTPFRDIALTSGTTGEPVIVPYTAADLKRLAFNEAVAFYGVGVRDNDALLLTVTLDRCFIAGLAYYSGATTLGASAIRSGPGQPARQWHIIEKLQPGVIVGVPTFLKELALWGLDHGIDVHNSPIHSLVTIGESTRKNDLTLTSLGSELEKLWGAKTFSSYGATEFETAFCECRASAGGHIHPELMIVEIVDDAGHLMPDGEAGEIVVTPMGVEGFPLIRFRTGDIGRIHSTPCDCGWNTKRLGPVEGRLAQRLKYRGTTLYPESIFHALQELMSVKHAYIEVRSAEGGGDDITVVVGSEDPALDAERIEDKLQAHLRVRPKVTYTTNTEACAVMTQDGGRKPVKFFDYRS